MFTGRQRADRVVDERWYRAFASLPEFEAHLAASAAALRSQASEELELIGSGLEFTISGFCHVCRRNTRFRVSDAFSYLVEGVRLPNWREHLKCETCGLNNRMRASVHLLDELLQPDRRSKIYMTEQVTPLYERLARRFDGLVGSEFLDAASPGGTVDQRGIRHEDLTALSFPSDSMDIILSFDVFEHIPAYDRGFAECLRVLKAEGAMLFSVPFLSRRQQTLVRAVVRADGSVTHLESPEYHGDPCRAEGCLAFYQFGWDLLERLRLLGFGEVQAFLYWSRRLGYLGREQMVFVARKSAT